MIIDRPRPTKAFQTRAFIYTYQIEAADGQSLLNRTYTYS